MKRVILLVAALACVSCRLLPQNRPTSTTPVCKNSLRIIDAAKEQAALRHAWTNGTPCDTPDAHDKIQAFVKKGAVVCPRGYSYRTERGRSLFQVAAVEEIARPSWPS